MNLRPLFITLICVAQLHAQDITTRLLTLNANLLNLPVCNGAPKQMVKLEVGGIRVEGTLLHVARHTAMKSSLSLQEARWAFLLPNAIDWNGDGTLDLVTGDITGNYLIYLNRVTKTQPKLDAARPLNCDGIDLHGMWRCRPALAKIGDRIALVIVDGDDHFHLYWRIDDYNLADGGKLMLDDGKPIGTSGGPGGMSGRCKLDSSIGMATALSTSSSALDASSPSPTARPASPCRPSARKPSARLCSCSTPAPTSA